MRVPRRIKGDLVFTMREKAAETSRYPRSRIDEILVKNHRKKHDKSYFPNFIREQFQNIMHF